MPVAGVAAEAALAAAGAAGAAVGDPAARRAAVAASLGYGLLGAVDDLAAVGDDRGFTGHLRAVAHGRLTTGGLKLLGGGALGLALAGWAGEGRARPSGPVGLAGLVGLAADGLLVALSANLGNLFDRAPGRTTKVALAAGSLLALATRGDERLVGVAATLGAGAALAGPDLRERLMLGDAGANPLGAAVGLGVVLVAPAPARLGVLAVVAALNLASEVVSFSRVIDRVPPLRALDRAGTLPERRARP